MVLNQCQGARLPIVSYPSEYPGSMTSKQMPINVSQHKNTNFETAFLNPIQGRGCQSSQGRGSAIMRNEL
jgi:hypothetical protein